MRTKTSAWYFKIGCAIGLVLSLLIPGPALAASARRNHYPPFPDAPAPTDDLKPAVAWSSLLTCTKLTNESSFNGGFILEDQGSIETLHYLSSSGTAALVGDCVRMQEDPLENFVNDVREQADNDGFDSSVLVLAIVDGECLGTFVVGATMVLSGTCEDTTPWSVTFFIPMAITNDYAQAKNAATGTQGLLEGSPPNGWDDLFDDIDLNGLPGTGTPLPRQPGDLRTWCVDRMGDKPSDEGLSDCDDICFAMFMRCVWEARCDYMSSMRSARWGIVTAGGGLLGVAGGVALVVCATGVGVLVVGAVIVVAGGAAAIGGGMQAADTMTIATQTFHDDIDSCIDAFAGCLCP